MTKTQGKAKAQRGSNKKPTSSKKPTSNTRASSHQSKSDEDTAETPPSATDGEYYLDHQEAEYNENYTWNPEPETRISTPSYISYTNDPAQASDYYGHPTWNNQDQDHSTAYTQSTNHSTNYAVPQDQSHTTGPPSTSYPPASSTPYQPPYPPTSEYPLTIPQLDSWANETSTSNMTVAERLTGRHYS